jgi:hypothetical protein
LHKPFSLVLQPQRNWYLIIRLAPQAPETRSDA